MEYQKDAHFGHGFLAEFNLLWSSAYVPTDRFSLIFLHFLNGKGTETLEKKAFPVLWLEVNKECFY